jgi:hypothetical protein
MHNKFNTVYLQYIPNLSYSRIAMALPKKIAPCCLLMEEIGLKYSYIELV